MGVELTDAAINELGKASSIQEINAQTNLAQGIIAQQRGTTVEAMSYFYNAVSFYPGLSEANGRLSTLSSNITSGNIGENVRNEIQKRNEWIKLLNEAQEFFIKHLPFELVYSTSLSQGNINYNRNTVELLTSITLKPSSSSFKILNDITAGLDATKKRREWEIGYWPISANIFKGYNDKYDRDRYLPRHIRDAYMDLDIELLNDTGKVISKYEGGISTSVYFPINRRAVGRNDSRLREHYYMDDPQSNGFLLIDTSKLEANTKNEKISFTVNANDITDNLTIKIVAVNGVNISRNSEYIRIITE